MKLTIENDKGQIELQGEVPSFADSMTINFEATPDKTLDAIEFFNDQKIKAASNEAAETA